MVALLHHIVDEHARSRSAELAVIDGERQLSWARLRERSCRLASAWIAEGIGPGDRIVWLAQNSGRLIEALLTASRLGAVLCPLNWRQSVDELEFVLRDLEPRLVLWQREEIGSKVGQARKRYAPGVWVAVDAAIAEQSDEYEEVLQRQRTFEGELGADADAAVLAIYTAAFEGRPNASLLSHRAVVVQSLVSAAVGHIDSSTRYLNSGPQFHIGMLQWTLTTLCMGGVNVVERRVDAREVCRIVQEHRCTHAFLVEPTVSQVVDEVRQGGWDIGSLRVPAVHSSLASVASPDLSPWGRQYAGYGQTELAGQVTFRGLSPGASGQHGRPSPVASVRISDPAGNEVPDGEVGEIVVRSPTVHNGYWRRPEVNAARFVNGWWRTRDVGRREPDGSVSFVGTVQRMIKSAAENIYPAEVEGCIATHPGVAEVVVIGVADPTWGQAVRAIVVPRPGRELTAAGIIEHCRARIASYKKPRDVVFVDEALPRSGAGFDYPAIEQAHGAGAHPWEGI